MNKALIGEIRTIVHMANPEDQLQAIKDILRWEMEALVAHMDNAEDIFWTDRERDCMTDYIKERFT